MAPTTSADRFQTPAHAGYGSTNHGPAAGDPAPWGTAKPHAVKGRGAISNIAGRYATQLIETIDDGWLPFVDDTDINPALKTTVTPELAKTNAPELLRRELAHKNYEPSPSPIAFGMNTDAYQPCERELRITTLDHLIARTLEPRAASPTRRLQTIEKLTQAEMIRQRFAKGLKRYGLNKSGRFAQLDCSLFRKPLSIPAAKKTDGQLDIFG